MGDHKCESVNHVVEANPPEPEGSGLKRSPAGQARRQDRTLRPRLDSSHCRTLGSSTVGGTGSEVQLPSSHWTTTVRQPYGGADADMRSWTILMGYS